MSPNVSLILAYALEEQSDSTNKLRYRRRVGEGRYPAASCSSDETLNGAGFLDRMNDMGTVDIGKNADLVLLDANPIERVQNLYGINAVIRAGAYHDNQKLSSMKERIGTK
ncbi:hypothetical protein NST07_03420 [Paenibacillus sp. FSL L8-0340]|uniref:hypothetical protein n=1 Tax=Paenibacillus sp. FSL L8-0340 TaxID=2954685 RepID=UPI00315981E8